MTREDGLRLSYGSTGGAEWSGVGRENSDSKPPPFLTNLGVGRSRIRGLERWITCFVCCCKAQLYWKINRIGILFAAVGLCNRFVIRMILFPEKGFKRRLWLFQVMERRCSIFIYL